MNIRRCFVPTIIVALTAICLVLAGCGSNNGGSESGPLLGGQFLLPDTGQTKCYTSSGAEISCTGTGQDGAHIVNHMNYTDNGDGTITDNNTGLIWQKQDDGIARANGWDGVGSYCLYLRVGGYSDWRLPSPIELISIVDYGIPYPKINTTYFPNTEGAYWTSTQWIRLSTNRWFVTFYDGLTGYDNAGNRMVRCVRGGQYAASFADNGDGTVTDNLTGLMWQQGEGNLKTWADALSYCNGLSLGGQSDWRLPNIKELQSITDLTAQHPAIDTAYFPNTHSEWYWSSTTTESNTGSAMAVDFEYGEVYPRDKANYHTYYARCVRGGRSASLGNLAVEH